MLLCQGRVATWHIRTNKSSIVKRSILFGQGNAKEMLCEIDTKPNWHQRCTSK
jgi:hypothetical protein